jgi:hypothetical protein
MSDETSSGFQAGGELQFDRADYAQETPAELSCDNCQIPLHDHYYEINGRMTCERCRYGLEDAFKTRPGFSGFAKALGAGLGAAAVGAGIYYAVLALSGYEFGLIAILVGWMVGKGVNWGTRGRGGPLYQTLAILLTYMAIVSTYIPLIVKEFDKQPPATEAAFRPVPSHAVTTSAAAGASPQAAGGAAAEEEIGVGDVVLGLGALLLLAAALPFLAGIENLIGLFIIGIALFEAWKLNKRVTLDISGPFRVGSQPSPPADAAV